MNTALRVGVAAIVAWSLSAFVKFGFFLLLSRFFGENGYFTFESDWSLFGINVASWFLAWASVAAVAGWTVPANHQQSSRAFGAVATLIGLGGVAKGWRGMEQEFLVAHVLIAVIGGMLIATAWLVCANRRLLTDPAAGPTTTSP